MISKELEKRILSSIILIPISIFFIFQESLFFIFFLSLVFLATVYEWLKMSKNINTKMLGIIFLLFSFYFSYLLRTENGFEFFLFVILISILTDIGGYIFGKTFKGPKLTKISPKKTYAGVIGSFILSVFGGLIFYESMTNVKGIFIINYISFEPYGINLNLFILFIILIILSACSSIPKNTQNSCAIFEERYLWYKHAKASYERWGAPIHLQLAFVKKESDFNWLAKPPRKKLFKVIPFKRPSSSFGYSQAVKGTWEQYKQETNSPLATRARFKDSVDFIGWYIHKTNKILKISKKDPYKQYLAYYKGWGDYKNYSKDKKAIIYAKSVKDMANKYRKQLTLCKKNLDKNKYIIF